MIKIGILIVLAAALAVTVICHPSWLAQNRFLSGFVNHEILAIMVIIVTVTLASVANIHLALNRLVLNKFKNKPQFVEAAKDVKREMNDNAWYIFYGLIVTLLLLLLRGAYPDDERVVAFASAGALWILTLYVLCMYDIYKVVFGIVELEMDLGAADGKGEDFTADSPQIGEDRSVRPPARKGRAGQSGKAKRGS